MEAFMLEFKEMKDSIKELKDNLEEVTEEIRGLKDLTSQQNDEISHLKKENEVLKDHIENLQNHEKDSDGGDVNQSSATFKDMITKIDMKVDKLKTEVINLMELDQPGAQQNTEIKTVEGKKILTFMAPTPTKLKFGQHPSKRAISRIEAQRRLEMRPETIKRSTFEVSLEKTSMWKDVRVWLGNYTDVITPCDFMDPISGVYMVPAQGDYEFTVDRENVSDSNTIFLCTDKDVKQQKICYFYDTSYTTRMCMVKKSLSWKCDFNDKVWIEAVGTTEDNTVTKLKFSGHML